MTRRRNDRTTASWPLAPLDEKVDHVRGSPAGRLILEYGDYECPYSRQAVPRDRAGRTAARRERAVRVPAFPLTGIHPHALAAASCGRGRRPAGPVLGHARAAVPPARRRSKTATCVGYAAQLGLDVAAFDRDRASTAVAGADPARRRQRPGLGPGARHAHPVHRRRRAPRRLRPAHPAGGTGAVKVIRSRGAR